MKRLAPGFFTCTPVECARRLIGGELRWDGCAGRIVETEAYAAEGDPACHTFFRPSSRRFVAEKPPGTAYIYLNYGVHWMFNILVRGESDAGFVLVRALEPVGGLEQMRLRRSREPVRDLCSGPGKLTRALGIDGRSHGRSFLDRPGRGIWWSREVAAVADPRIGISRGQDLLWRFTESGSRFVSRKVRTGEK